MDSGDWRAVSEFKRAYRSYRESEFPFPESTSDDHISL